MVVPCCRYLTPLLVSLAVQLEPVLGPALGWAVGVAAAPGLFTWIGGSVVLLATIGATLATAKRQQQEEAAAAADAEERRMLKNKSMRLPSFNGGDGSGIGNSSSGYTSVTGVEEHTGVNIPHEGGSLHGVARVGHVGGCSRGGGYGGGHREGDMDVIVSEREQLLPGGSQLSHHVKHVKEHQEIELPDAHQHG